MSDTINNAPEMVNRKPKDTRFRKGDPRAGRPQGSRSKTTLLAEKLMGDDLEAVTRSVINAARNGDMTAARIIMDRMSPVRKGRPVKFDVPDMMDAGGVAEAFKRLMETVGAGKITPEEATQVANILELRRKAIETMEIEQRLKVLEEREDE